MPNPQSRRRVVWVVDDSPTDAERARRTLSNAYAVEVFKDGSEVLERLATQGAPDLLVLDWVMPGISGIEVCQYLRDQDRASDVAILLLTQQNATEQIVHGLSAGANDFLSKPYAAEELLARVGALMRTRALMERHQQMESTVRSLLANAPDALLAVDASGRITFANAQAMTALAERSTSLVGKSISDVVPELAMDTISVGQGEPLLVVPDVKVGGRVYSPSVRVLPMDDAANTTISLRDVTERRMADARRLDFYSMIAHDLRTPLSAMLLRSEVMLRKRGNQLTPELTGDIYSMQRSINSLVAMVNDFLDLARMEGTSQKIECEALDMVTLVQKVVEEFRPLAEASKLSLELKTDGQAAPVSGDQRRLVQVLGNLLGNAIKFTPPGGRVTAKVTALPDFVDTLVTDTGRGISSEALPRIFERYTRALDSEHQVAGTGLGLMIVKEIVEAHGGTVGVSSRPNEGSTFWFRLPRSGAPARAA